MNILWAGQEDISFPNGNTVYYGAGGADVDSGYARAGIANRSAYGTGFSALPCIGKSFPAGAVTSCYLTFRVYVNANATSIPVGAPLVGLTYAGASNGAGLYVALNTSTNNKLALVTWSGSSQVVLAAESSESFTSGKHNLTMQVTNYGASANVKIYIDSNSSPVIDFTGDVRIAGLTSLNRVGLFGNNRPESGVPSLTFSEIIVADGDCHACRLVTRYGTSTDAGNEWTGGHGDIDEQVLSDADAIYSNTADKDAIIGLSDLPSGDFAVDAIVIAARAIAPSGATANKLKLGADIGGTTDVDAGQDLTTSWVLYERIAHTLNGSQIDPSGTLKLVMRTDAAA